MDNSDSLLVEQLEQMERLYEEQPSGNLSGFRPPHPDISKIRVPEAKFITMQELIVRCRDTQLERYCVEALKMSTFSNWEYSEFELLLFLRHMFYELKFVEKFNIKEENLNIFLLKVYCYYNRTPFHNFKHGFMVAQMTYALIYESKLQDLFPTTELLALMIAALCHDLDHPGLSNYYQTVMQTTLCAASQGRSPLQYHHWEVTQRILDHPGDSILDSMGTETRTQVLKSIRRLILVTGIERHEKLMAVLKAASKTLTEGPVHLKILQSFLLKLACRSNEARPVACSRRWISCLYKEIFSEAKFLQEAGMKVPSYMDPRLVRKSESHIKYVRALPLRMADALLPFMPQLERIYMRPIHALINSYQSSYRRYYEEAILRAKKHHWKYECETKND